VSQTLDGFIYLFLKEKMMLGGECGQLGKGGGGGGLIEPF